MNIRKRMIEVTKTNFVNKGAELMLLAIIHKLRKERNDIEFVIQPTLKTSTYIRRAQLGLYQKIGFERLGIEWGKFGALIPYSVRRSYGLVIDNEVDVVLDASGFSYSDQFGPGPSIRAAKKIENWKINGTKVILLPQAFGPFEKEATKNAMGRIIKAADLIFARDKSSFSYLKTLVPSSTNIFIAPDFTNLIPGVVPEYYNSDIHRICIIPNSKMIDKTSSDVRNNYIPFLAGCIDYLKTKKAHPFLLLHELGDDYLAKKIQEMVSVSVPIISEADPLKVKGIIGGCCAVVSSRYHGLVSALSQGVPCIATGWSHKYFTLLEDYNCSECIVDVKAPEEMLFQKLDLVVENAGKLTENIRNAAEKQKKLTEDMWLKVIKVTLD